MTEPEDYAKRYRDNLIETVDDLHQTEQMIFFKIVNLSMSNELREIDEVFEPGDDFHFELAHFEDSTDTNVNLLINLLKEVSATKESIANINAIEEKEESPDDDSTESEESDRDNIYNDERFEKLDKKQKIQFELINQILWGIWDPYGINENDGSIVAYEETSWLVYELKKTGAGIKELAELLFSEEQNEFGQSASYQNCEKVAGIIHAL